MASRIPRDLCIVLVGGWGSKKMIVSEKWSHRLLLGFCVLLKFFSRFVIVMENA